jgi:hypothetical protein
VAVRVTKVDGRGWHPRENDWQIRRSAVEVERSDAGVPQEAWRRQDIFSTHAKRGMQRDALRRGSGGPEPEHCFVVGANPKERGLMIPGDVRQREANDVAIEPNRHVDVADGEVHFEQLARFNHQTSRKSAIVGGDVPYFIRLPPYEKHSAARRHSRQGWNKVTTGQVIE